MLSAKQTPETLFEPDFFPFSVWYSGGDARAPMLSEITPESREEWLEDLQQINGYILKSTCPAGMYAFWISGINNKSCL